MTPIDQLIKQKQFDRAKALSEQLLKRIKLVDTFALNKTNIDSRARVNKSYLLSLLLADTYQCYLASNYINNLIPTFSADQSLSISNELGGDQKAYETAGLSEGYDADLTSRFTVNITHRLDRDLDTLVLSEYKSYWKGIELFRAKQFDESAKEFNKCRGKAKSNILLHDLCSIWLARSYIWKQLKQHSENKKETLAILRELKQEITLPNLASDIADYINYLEVAAKQ